MSFRAALCALLAALLLAGCGGTARDDERLSGSDGPALWEIRKDGALEGWLFGTIHALPDGTSWRTDRFDAAFDASDLLVLEITEYDGSFDRDEALQRLAITRGLPLPSQRLDKDDRPALRSAFAQAGLDEREFRNVESWAIALSLSSALSRADPANGIDRKLYGEARNRKDYPVVALEGAERQLGIFDRLPESAQLALLEGVAAEAEAESDEDGRVEHWRTGDLAKLEGEITSGYMAQPLLLAALLNDRNLDWVPRIATLLEAGPKPFIAVGAGHMLGDTALDRLLAEAGYEVVRIQ